jgi:uncharacterized membrane protein
VVVVGIQHLVEGYNLVASTLLVVVVVDILVEEDSFVVVVACLGHTVVEVRRSFASLTLALGVFACDLLVTCHLSGTKPAQDNTWKVPSSITN